MPRESGFMKEIVIIDTTVLLNLLNKKVEISNARNQ